MEELKQLLRDLTKLHPTQMREVIAKNKNLNLFSFLKYANDVYFNVPKDNIKFWERVTGKNLERFKKEVGALIKVLDAIVAEQRLNKLTHREEQILHEARVAAGQETLLSSKQLKAIAANRYQAKLGLIGKKGKPPTNEEFDKLIKVASDPKVLLILKERKYPF